MGDVWDFWVEYHPYIIVYALRIFVFGLAVRSAVISRGLRRDWIRVDKLRAQTNSDEVQRIVAGAWVTISTQLIYQAIGVMIVIGAGIFIPNPSPPQISVSFLSAIAGFLLFKFSVYHIVTTMRDVGEQVERYLVTQERAPHDQQPYPS